MKYKSGSVSLQSYTKYKLQTGIIFPVIFMDLSKFYRENGVFDFIFKIRLQQDFFKIWDIQIYEWM